MTKTLAPTHAGMVRFYETVKPVLLEKYQLVLTVTLTSFEIRNGDGKLLAAGDSIDWLNGFVAGIDTRGR